MRHSESNIKYHDVNRSVGLLAKDIRDDGVDKKNVLPDVFLFSSSNVGV